MPTENFNLDIASVTVIEHKKGTRLGTSMYYHV